MGLCLIAAQWTDPSLWIAVVKVLIAFGLIIFVHELGHFAVAKLCGVKCEKFYLGFDLWGWKLFKYRWGETEYGIGICPLGGYVKMLGQEDNPARLREELERAQQTPGGGEAVTSHPKGEKPIDVEAAKQALYDPRSYLAKSVPKRMAIISAGVVMNLIFAFVTATIAFGLGIERVKCVVGQTVPGDAAWQEGIRSGDEVVEIAGKRIDSFEDMRQAVSLGDDIQRGLPVVVRRPGVEDPLTFTLVPDSTGQAPRIGIGSSLITSLAKKNLPVVPGSAAARATPGFALADRIVEIDGIAMEEYRQIRAYLGQHPDKPIEVVVARAVEPADGSAGRPTERVAIEVAPNPMRRLGLVMTMGPICGVQKGSPAEAAGIRPGDVIERIDGQTPGDPVTLPERLRHRAGETLALSLRREGAKGPIDVEATLRPADWFEGAVDYDMADLPVALPSLGVAFHVLNRVDSVLAGSPAAEAGLKPGDVLVAATLIPPEEQTPEERKLEQRKAKISFDDEENRNALVLINSLQLLIPKTEVELAWVRQEEPMKATLVPRPSSDWFNPDRGFIFQPLTFVEKADSFGEAARLGAAETVDATLLIYRILQKLGTRQVKATALGGPISIFAWLKQAAEKSTAELLITLTLLSANLAVINFLPIPVLDGGHMVFLTWEAIRRKPADERVQLVLTYVGLAVLLSLMAWVIGLDLFRLASGFF